MLPPAAAILPVKLYGIRMAGVFPDTGVGSLTRTVGMTRGAGGVVGRRALRPATQRAYVRQQRRWRRVHGVRRQ
jgi:hypothetical protein